MFVYFVIVMTFRDFRHGGYYACLHIDEKHVERFNSVVLPHNLTSKYYYYSTTVFRVRTPKLFKYLRGLQSSGLHQVAYSVFTDQRRDKLVVERILENSPNLRLNKNKK